MGKITSKAIKPAFFIYPYYENFKVAPSFFKEINLKYPTIFTKFYKVLENKDYKNILIVASKAGFKIVRTYFNSIFTENPHFMKEKKLFYQLAHNDFFGGDVKCAGLLIVDDYVKYINKFIKKKKMKPDVILVSATAFNLLGEDLVGKLKYEISDTFKTEVVLV